MFSRGQMDIYCEMQTSPSGWSHKAMSKAAINLSSTFYEGYKVVAVLLCASLSKTGACTLTAQGESNNAAPLFATYHTSNNTQRPIHAIHITQIV